MNNIEKKKIFNDYLKNNKILIVDKNSTSRSRLRKSLIDFGADAENLFVSSGYPEVMDIIKEHKPKLVLSDYKIVKGSGFDLFREYKLSFPELKDIISILITSNSSQSLVAKAAEEDVDSFLIKPYTVKGIEQNLTNVIINKLYPSKYLVTIDQGKELLFEQEYEKAVAVFAEAIKLNPKPSLALFYHGQAKYLLDLVNDAEKDYKEGLLINKIHFKCQVGLYETLKAQNRPQEAYEVVRNIARLFPANPDRLAEVVRLCVVTKNYHDMLEYYNIYTDLETRTEALKKHVMAGMYITGKFNLLNNNKEGAVIFFNKVAISCEQDLSVLNPMLDLMLEYKIFETGREVLTKYPLGTGEGKFEIYDYQFNFEKLSDFERISKAEYIINNISKNSSIFHLLLGELKNRSDKVDLYKKYLLQAKEAFPAEFSEVA